MERRYFPAQVEGAEGAYGVYFPDLPGCVSAGETIAEALAGAEEALALHVAGMGEDGDDIPRPSDAVLLEGSIAVAMVAATMPGKRRDRRRAVGGNRRGRAEQIGLSRASRSA